VGSAGRHQEDRARGRGRSGRASGRPGLVDRQRDSEPHRALARRGQGGEVSGRPRRHRARGRSRGHGHLRQLPLHGIPAPALYRFSLGQRLPPRRKGLSRLRQAVAERGRRTAAGAVRVRHGLHPQQ